jgi:hypothetical protein
MFFAVHELEGWLFSNPDIFPNEVRKAVAGKSIQPEKVNFDEPPAKHLDKIYNQRLKKS